MAHAICRGCGSEGDVGATTKKVNKGFAAGGWFHQCTTCSSIDVDVLSPEGLKHERTCSDLEKEVES